MGTDGPSMMNVNETISAWLNKQHEWIKEAATKIITKGRLTDEDYVDLVRVLKQVEPSAAVVRNFPTIGRDISQGKEIRLVSIGSISGIDALNPRTPLAFGSTNLSVIFGGNGSGKSGYTRIISKASGSDHGIELKSNVYENGRPQTRSAIFKYLVDSECKQVEWADNLGPIEDLKAIDIFDTECGRIYLEKEKHLTYEPLELVFFAELVSVCKKVEGILIEERNQLVTRLPKLPERYARSQAGSCYQSLGESNARSYFKTFNGLTIDESSRLSELDSLVRNKDPRRIAKEERNKSLQINTVISQVETALEGLSQRSIDSAINFQKDLTSKTIAAEEAARAVADSFFLDGLGSESWKLMWEAAKSYSTKEAYKDQDFPNIEDAARCVLCQQELSVDAKLRLKTFEQFVLNELQSQLTAAKSRWQSFLTNLPVLTPRVNLSLLVAACNLTDETDKELDYVWSELNNYLFQLKDGALVKLPQVVFDRSVRLIATLKTASGRFSEEAAKLEDTINIQSREKLEAELIELEAKKWIGEQKDAVAEELTRLAEYQHYDDVLLRKTTTTGISRMAGEVAERLITESYVQRFNNELCYLGADHVRVELVKAGTRSGKPAHRIRLKNAVSSDAKLSDVLSEGERRIVALAAFIADVVGSSNKAPFVFDDPITSLDQVYEERVVDRLIELSEERQVLVFTHRVAFLGLINDKAGSSLTELCIRRESWGTGQPGDVPIFAKKPMSIIMELKNTTLSKAKKLLESSGHEAYYREGKSICSDFRILLERIVETEFLADVVQRHRRSVNTMGKIFKLSAINQEDCQVIDSFMTKYSRFEHSQSVEVPVSVPEPTEIERDIDTLMAWHKDFKKRRDSTV